MMTWRLRGRCGIKEGASSLDVAYEREVGWTQGLRISGDARLVLVGFQRLLSTGLVEDSELREASVVLGCRLGSMENYENFDHSMDRGQPAPLAFSNALPSTPLASAAVRFGLRGHTYTMTGGLDVGIKALGVAVRLLQARRANQVIVGCWESPSETATPLGMETQAHLVLAVIERRTA
jgi:3-oxoacyl-(acyl-carrier-protein) synthase